MTKIRVTIGLCVKNSEKTIENAIESIISQDFSHENMEIIVVDGGSKDKTIDIIKNSLSRTKIKLILLFDKGEGLGVARQMVVDNASREYIVWVDSDVVLSKSFLKKQLEFMEKHTEVGMARGKAEYRQSDFGLVANVQGLLFSLLEGVYLGATICRTKALREINGFDKRIKGASEDVDVKTRLLLKGWKTTMNPAATFYHVAKDTMRSIYRQNLWYGMGDHFLSHKYEGFINIFYRLPPVFFGWGLKLSRKSYWQHRKKKSFLIPLLCALISICWWIGFIKGHIRGYGHAINKHEIKKETLLKLKQRVNCCQTQVFM
jgi:glycosyltransferase involved in cell wall biosynthesis